MGNKSLIYRLTFGIVHFDRLSSRILHNDRLSSGIVHIDRLPSRIVHNDRLPSGIVHIDRLSSRILQNDRLSSGIVYIKRSLTLRSESDLGIKMKSFNDKKQFKKSLQLFDEYKETNLHTCSNLIISEALKACAQTGDIQRGTSIHHIISSRIKHNSNFLFSLISLYMQSGDTKQAQSLFDTSSKKSLPMCAVMMKGYIRNNQAIKAVEIFHQIKNPDQVIILLLFNACAQLETIQALNLIRKVSKQIPKSFYSDPRVVASLLDALMECGDIVEAQLLFDESTNKSLSMYGAMMKGCIRNNQANKAIEIFHQIKNPDQVIILLLFNACARLGTKEELNLIKKVSKEIPKCFYSSDRLVASLLDALMKCNDILAAQSLFNTSKDKTNSMYGAMMNGFNKINDPFKTLDFFNQMKIDGIKPNGIIYLCLIKALASVGDYSLSQSFVKQIPKFLLTDKKIQTALIDMWGKTACVDLSKEIFDKIAQPDQVVYAAMINSYGLNGMGVQALQLYRQMSEELKNEITDVCVLNACSHSGLVQEARSIFENIQIKTLKIFTSMIDCLSRAYFFEEARKLIDEFEDNNPPAIPMYMALLSGVRNENNAHLAQQIYDRIQKRFPHLTNSLVPATILLANIYASSGEIEKASDIRIQLTQSGVKKQIGLSWTVVGGKVYQFRAHDQSHPRSKEIYAEIEKMSKELIEHGHIYDSSWVTRPIGQDETVVSVLCGHSERIAIAWNFVHNPKVSHIQVVKNLRVCGDCHRATKLIAAIRQCEIIVRDANRIHHFFRNGQCSCNDFF